MKSKNDFQIGFEVECVINGNVFPDRRSIQAQLDKIIPGIKIHDDGSIDCCDVPEYMYNDGSYSAEIVTPPLKTEKAFEVLNKVFKLIHKGGWTNESCGLHVNISPIDTKVFNKMNLLYIAYHPIFKEITEAFGREDNEYSTPNKMPNDLWYNVVSCTEDLCIHQEKEAAVNLAYAYRSNGRTRRIEVRAFGNEGYHRKLGKVKSYVYKILTVFCNSTKYNFDYMK